MLQVLIISNEAANSSTLNDLLEIFYVDFREPRSMWGIRLIVSALAAQRRSAREQKSDEQVSKDGRSDDFIVCCSLHRRNQGTDIN